MNNIVEDQTEAIKGAVVAAEVNGYSNVSSFEAEERTMKSSGQTPN